MAQTRSVCGEPLPAISVCYKTACAAGVTGDCLWRLCPVSIAPGLRPNRKLTVRIDQSSRRIAVTNSPSQTSLLERRRERDMSPAIGGPSANQLPGGQPCRRNHPARNRPARTPVGGFPLLLSLAYDRIGHNVCLCRTLLRFAYSRSLYLLARTQRATGSPLGDRC